MVFVFQVLGFLKATLLAGQEEVNHLERGPALRSGDFDSESECVHNLEEIPGCPKLKHFLRILDVSAFKVSPKKLEPKVIGMKLRCGHHPLRFRDV
jgi:hypothetical protein